MRTRSMALVGVVLAGTLAQPVVAGPVPLTAGDAGARTVPGGGTGPGSRVPLPNPPSASEEGFGSGVEHGTMTYPCGCLTVRLPTFDSPFEKALAAS